VESAGANLMRYRVEGFVQGGALFRNLARLSAAGIPVITVQHGSGTAGGAYMPGLSDVVIMVRDRSRAFLAGPPLLMAATGEVATEEELGGAQMHASVSGLGEQLAEDDRHALGLARQVVARTSWSNRALAQVARAQTAINSVADELRCEPLYPAEDLLGLVPDDLRQPLDMHEVIARLVDGSDFLPFKALYGAATVCVQARVDGHAVGIISNNGPIDVAGANKAAHFIQLMCQLGHPIIYLQNTTGYMVGRDSEQAARTMQSVSEAALARKGLAPDAAQSKAQFDKTVALFEAQADVFYTSGLVLDDGVIDPRDTRAVLAQCLAMCAEADARQLRPMQFGVARM